MKIKSFLLFESKDSGYFIDMRDQLEEYFPTLKIITGFYKDKATLDIQFYRGDKGIDFINLTNILEFWMDVLENGKYEFKIGTMTLNKEGKNFITRNFKNWINLKGYILQFGGQEYSRINAIKIEFN